MFKSITKEIFKYILIGFLIFLFLFPIYYLLLYALLSTPSYIEGKIYIWVREWSWSNFKTVIGKEFFIALGYTFLFSTILIILRIIVFSLAIAGLLKMKPVFQKIFQYFFLLISLIPEFSIYLALATQLGRLNLRGGVFSVVSNSIFNFFTFGYIFNVAKATSLERQKLMINDNLKWYEKIWYVYRPKLQLAYFLLIIFTFIATWNDYLWPDFIVKGTKLTNLTIWYINVGVYQAGVLGNLQAAGSFLTILVPLIIYSVFSKKINQRY
ncbi:carbohydrate ABC transporter permease [Mycoplasmopsis phocirhinis]|uniref:Carbohydrate ABC transporter permease n=1 Tax=Mycoplasmopsis phocirhinis TaxID=142650 RepID=A0A4P6MSI5_9BACT|nr:carbohydrate ABC transporter permease [Mycoplasmopsis phocirhinis]QBF34821.1 carbohydrate ABC transporter permease [Mycoplasmopsis phocirhinis]